MARFIYALSGEGRGHTSRAMAITCMLRERGHEVQFCCGGTARHILEEHGEPVIRVPALQHAMEGNRVKVIATLRRNWSALVGAFDTIDRLTDVFDTYDPDLLVTDFEAFSPRAASRLDLPVISFNHQQVVTETRYEVPPAEWLDAALAQLVIELIAPSRPDHVMLTSFFYPPLRHPGRVTMVPPIIRPEVRAAGSVQGEHVLVYYNHGEGAEDVLTSLRGTDHKYVVYGFPNASRYDSDPRLQVKEPSIDGFLKDLATSRAVICTAGFTLMSEALYLGKPLLVVPNDGIFEQQLNARFLEREGLGERVEQGNLSSEVVERFLARTAQYRKELSSLNVCGNEEAVDRIEEMVAEQTVHAVPVTG